MLHSASSRLLLLFGVFLICMAAFSVLGMLISWPFSGTDSLAEFAMFNKLDSKPYINAMKLNQVITALGSFMVPTFIYNKWIAKADLLPPGVYKMPRLMPLLLGVLLILLALPLINYMAQLNSRLSLPDALKGIEQAMRDMEARTEKLVEAFMQMNGFIDLLVNLFVIALVAAVAEEFFFRGALQNALVNLTGNVHSAIIIASVLFSALHFQFLGFLPRMVIGIVLGYLYVWSGSLWLPIVVHFTNNAFAVLAAFCIQRNWLPRNVETIGAGNEELLVVGLSVLPLLMLLWILRKYYNRKA